MVEEYFPPVGGTAQSVWRLPRAGSQHDPTPFSIKKIKQSQA